MSTYSKPPQQGTGKAPQEGGLLQRYTASPTVPATPEQAGNMASAANAGKSKQPPRSFINGPVPPVPTTPPDMVPPSNGNGNGAGAKGTMGTMRPMPPGPMNRGPQAPTQATPMNRGPQAPTQATPMNRGPQAPAQATPMNRGPQAPTQTPGSTSIGGAGRSQMLVRPGSHQPVNGPGLGLLQQRGAAQAPAPPTQQPMQPMQPLEREGNSIILYRNANFSVRTTVRPGLQRANHPLREHTGNTAMIPKVMPMQKQHVAESETRVMPSVGPINPLKRKQIPVPAWFEAVVIVIGLAAALVVRAFNMFGFPRYEIDEGTYMSAAWAVLHGQIWPYAYGYGHPPAAWILIAAWVQLTGGFFTFGNAVNTGRVLMLILALASSLLVYLIVRRLGSSRTAGLLAMIIFALSPLSTTFGRQIYLDNVGSFWLLLALFLMVVGNSRLLFIVGAALSLAMAILSKEVFVMFIPAMIYGAWLHATPFQRKFALVAFIYVTLAFSSSFVLMAVLRGELFPASWHVLGDNHDHLSLLATYIGQAQRGSSQGSFWTQWIVWMNRDRVLVAFGVVTVAFNLAVGWWNRKQLFVSLLAISFWILLIRGGVVLSFYIIPLLPLMAINAAFAFNTLFGWLGKVARFDLLRVALLLCVLAVIVPYDLLSSGDDFTQNPTTAQSEAIAWVRSHVPHNAFIVVNDWMFVDLRQPGGEGVGTGATYPFANLYNNVATDPAVTNALLGKNYDRIDYVVDDQEMDNDIHRQPAIFGIILQAIAHSAPVAYFTSGVGYNAEPITIYQVVHEFPQPIVMTSPGPSPQADVSPLSDRNPILDRRALMSGIS
jgi:hypothetical protein